MDCVAGGGGVCRKFTNIERERGKNPTLDGGTCCMRGAAFVVNLLCKPICRLICLDLRAPPPLPCIHPLPATHTHTARVSSWQ